MVPVTLMLPVAVKPTAIKSPRPFILREPRKTTVFRGFDSREESFNEIISSVDKEILILQGNFEKPLFLKLGVFRSSLTIYGDST
jgi:hypothetical protein